MRAGEKRRGFAAREKSAGAARTSTYVCKLGVASVKATTYFNVLTSTRMAGDGITPGANPQIGQLTFLKRKPDSQRAHSLLQDLTKAVSYLMLKNKLKVGTLAEFYPRDKRLLGLNVNAGMKIMVRLRSPYNDAEFLSWESIMETMIHELTHNRFGPHDSKFHKQMEEFRVDQWYYERMGMHNTFLGSGRKLGGSGQNGTSNRGRVRRGGFVGKGKKLGSGSSADDRIAPGQGLTPREMAALAAAKRHVNDEAEMCHDDTVDVEEVLHNHSQMESQIEVVVIPDEDSEEKAKTGAEAAVQPQREVIELRDNEDTVENRPGSEGSSVPDARSSNTLEASPGDNDIELIPLDDQTDLQTTSKTADSDLEVIDLT